MIARQLQTRVLYIPGMGHRYDPIRRLALKLWRMKGVKVEFIPMRWQDKTESYDDKIQRVRSVMRSGEDARIVLIGESAGGSVAVSETLKPENHIAKCITICGKNARADQVSRHVFYKNPAFKKAMEQVDQATSSADINETGRITIFRSYFDRVISRTDTEIKGANLRRLPAIGHLPAVFTVLFFLWPMVLHEAVR